MSWATYVPLGLAFVTTVVLMVTPLSVTVNRVFARISILLFGDIVANAAEERRRERRDSLRAAHLPTTHREYGAKTLLYAVLVGVVSGIVALYLAWAVLLSAPVDVADARPVLPDSLGILLSLFDLASAATTDLLALLAGSLLLVGVPAGVVTYQVRWWLPQNVANARARRIDATLPQTVAFIYALSRSGMAFPKIMRILGSHRDVYGESAEEIRAAVQNMDVFGMDLLSAIKDMSRRTPSDGFKEFSENLSSVLQSGRSLSRFLNQQYEEYQEEAEAQQEQLLNLVATLAEVYVTAFVAGPLFLITILVIIGIAVSSTTTVLELLIYLVFPLGNVAFIIYLDTVTGLGSNVEVHEAADYSVLDMSDVPRATNSEAAFDGQTDGGRADDARRHGSTRRATIEANRERLAQYRTVESLRERIGSPIQTIVENPLTLFWVTVPIALVFLAIRVPAVLAANGLDPAAVDDIIIQTALFLVGSFAIVYEIHKRRIEAIEAAVPDFLDRFASVNEAGMSVVESLNRVRGSELGALDEELDRVWTDIKWGANVETALRRFEARIRTQTISRVVTLITNSMNASGDLAAVLRIAADQAKADRRLKRERKQEMLTYVVVVYISFLVFMVIIGALNTVLIPNLPTSEMIPNVTDEIGSFGPTRIVNNIGTVNEELYTLLFFHTTLIQGAFSGLVAGQMSGGSVSDGAKHAAILMAVAYAGFVLMP